MIIPELNLVIAYLIVLLLLVFIFVVLGYVGFTVFKYRGREERSVDSVYLQVSVPRLNEIKTDHELLDKRPEQLSVAQFIELTNFTEKMLEQK